MRKIGLLVGVSFGLATLALTPDLAAAEHVTVVPRPGVVAQPASSTCSRLRRRIR
jgi:hypothetical protein